MKYSLRRGLTALSVLTFTTLGCAACALIAPARPPVVQAQQVQTPPPELLRLNPDGTLAHPCPRAALPVETVDPVSGRTTAAAGEWVRFGAESDGFVGVCEGRVILGAVALAEGERIRARVQEDLRPRTWLERLTPWRE